MTERLDYVVSVTAPEDAFGVENATFDADKDTIWTNNVACFPKYEYLEQQADRIFIAGKHEKILGLPMGELSFGSYLESHGQGAPGDGNPLADANPIAKLLASSFGLAPRLCAQSQVAAGSTASLIIQNDESGGSGINYAAGDLIPVVLNDGSIEVGYIYSTATTTSHTLALALSAVPAEGNVIPAGVVCKWQEELDYQCQIEAVSKTEDGAVFYGCVAKPKLDALIWSKNVTCQWEVMSAGFDDDMTGRTQPNAGAVRPTVASKGIFRIGPYGAAQTASTLTRLGIEPDFGLDIDGHQDPGDETRRWSSYIRKGAELSVKLFADRGWNPPGSGATLKEALRTGGASYNRFCLVLQFGKTTGQIAAFGWPGLQISDAVAKSVADDGHPVEEALFSVLHAAVAAGHPPVVAGFF